MAEKTEQVPEWVKEIWNHICEKPYKYKDLIENSFAIKVGERDLSKGYAFGLGFLFSEGLCPGQMESDLRKFKTVEEVAQSESLNLIEGERTVPYKKNLPLKKLAIGYLGKRPSLEEIDKVFSAYDTIKAKLKE